MTKCIIQTTIAIRQGVHVFSPPIGGAQDDLIYDDYKRFYLRQQLISKL